MGSGEDGPGQRRTGKMGKMEKWLHFMVFALRVSLCTLHIYCGEGTGRNHRQDLDEFPIDPSGSKIVIIHKPSDIQWYINFGGSTSLFSIVHSVTAANDIFLSSRFSTLGIAEVF